MQIKRFFPYATLIMLLTLVFSATSCDDDDGYSLNDYWVGIGTIKTEGIQGGYYMEMDNGDRLFPSAQNFHYQPIDGQRAIINYTKLYEEDEFYDYLVRVNYISNILTKGPIDLTAVNQDSIGNDKVQIEEFWMHQGYLNIVFGYNGSGTGVKHFINLANNTTVGHPNDGKVHLEFRHNANKDAAIYGFRTVVSFDVRKAFPTGIEEGVLVFKANTFREGMKEFSVKVDLDEDESTILSITQKTLEDIAKESQTGKY